MKTFATLFSTHTKARFSKVTKSRLIPSLLLAAVASNPAMALNIVLSNDDGLSSNVVALYTALKADGHNVIVSVPCQNQSGMGGASYILTPMPALTVDCKNGAVLAGSAAAGQMTKAGFNNGDFFYVNGTPVMAMLYGVDVQAKARWNALPDIVLSGPNEGQNVGHAVSNSGTVGNVIAAVTRGIPAIAFSAGTNTTDNTNLANPLSATVANYSVQLLKAVQAKAGTGPLLPPRLALNVNFPNTISNPKFRFARVGTYEQFNLKFVSDLGADPIAQATGLGAVHTPGISVDLPSAPATAEQADDDAVVSRTDISVAILQDSYEHRPAGQEWLRLRLRDLLTQ